MSSHYSRFTVPSVLLNLTPAAEFLVNTNRCFVVVGFKNVFTDKNSALSPVGDVSASSDVRTTLITKHRIVHDLFFVYPFFFFHFDLNPFT